MSAPDRIWATPFDYDYSVDGGTYCDAATRPTPPNHDAHEYLAREGETVTALVEALRAWKAAGDDQSYYEAVQKRNAALAKLEGR